MEILKISTKTFTNTLQKNHLVFCNTKDFTKCLQKTLPNVYKNTNDTKNTKNTNAC